MELFFFATGAKHNIDFFETQMQTIRCTHPFVDKDGKEGSQMKYGMIEPINLYRFVCPKGDMPKVLKSLGLPKAKGTDNYERFDTKTAMLRKMMGLKKIQPVDADVPIIPMNLENIGIKAIGVKDDLDITDHLGRTYEGI